MTQGLTLVHYLHVWSFYGLSVTIIDLFLFLHLRSSFVVLVDRISKYHHYRRASVEINSRYADATAAELQHADDFCAICRESMDSAKKLPCGHLFHRSCITQWMEYKGICPSCRAPLLHTATAREAAATQQRQEQQRQQQRLAAMYPAQAAAHLAQQQGAAQPAPAQPSTSPPINDDNLEATMALIRQLQAQDAAQFGGLGFSMLNLGGGAAAGTSRRRGPAQGAAGLGPEVEEKSAQEGLGQAGVGGPHPIRGMIGRSLFHFNSRSIASWLPSFSFELVRSVADELPPLPNGPAVPLPHMSLSAAAPAADERKEQEASPFSPVTSPPAASSASSFESALVDEEKAAPASSSGGLSAAATLPSAAPTVVRSTSDRSRRDVILEATQRRLQHAASSTSSSSPSSSSSSSTSSSSPSPALSSPFPSPPVSPPRAASEHESALCGSEMEDGAFDDINCGRDGEESEWSDEDAIVHRITAALESKEREVEAHTSPHTRPPRTG